MITKIISGGQTGADRAVLDVAIWHNFPHGGCCPNGRRAEDGCLGGQYVLNETPSKAYPQRAEWNVRDSDGTIIFTFQETMTRGCLTTAKFAQKHNKPCLHIFKGSPYHPEVAIQEFIKQHDVKILNIAGSRESTNPGIYEWVKSLLDRALFWSESHPGMLGGPGEG